MQRGINWFRIETWETSEHKSEAQNFSPNKISTLSCERIPPLKIPFLTRCQDPISHSFYITTQKIFLSLWIFDYQKCVRQKECESACMCVLYMCVYMSMLMGMFVCMCARMSVCMCFWMPNLLLNTPQPTLGCLKILEVWSRHLFASLEDHFPIRVVCSTITLEITLDLQ